MSEQLQQELNQLLKEWQERADNLYKNGESDDTAQYNYLAPAKMKSAVLYGCIQSLSKLLAWCEANDKGIEEIPGGAQEAPSAPQKSFEQVGLERAEAFGRWFEGRGTVPHNPLSAAREAWWAALHWNDSEGVLLRGSAIPTISQLYGRKP